MWPYTIFWDSYAFFCKSSINKCLLMLNPLSIALSPCDNTNFWFSCKYALRTLSMRTSVLPNISNLPQFSTNSVTKDFWYYCLALSTSFADSHSICSIFHLDFRISVLIRLFRTILLGDKDGAFLTIKYFSGHLSCSFSNTDTAIFALHLKCICGLQPRELNICFNTVSNFIPSDFQTSTLITLSAVVVSYKTSHLRLIFIKTRRSSPRLSDNNRTINQPVCI